MPDSPYLVTLAAPENAPATLILPNGQHYTRPLDETTGALATTVEVWDHDVEAAKALGFRDPSEVEAAQQAQAAFWSQPDQGAGGSGQGAAQSQGEAPAPPAP